MALVMGTTNPIGAMACVNMGVSRGCGDVFVEVWTVIEWDNEGVVVCSFIQDGHEGLERKPRAAMLLSGKRRRKRMNDEKPGEGVAF